MKIFILLFLFLSASYSSTVKILDIYEYKNEDIRELSALAFDGEILYALSDYGEIHHFKVNIENKTNKAYKIIQT